jgi:hypothetical protein
MRVYLWEVHCEAVSHCGTKTSLPVIELFSAPAPYLDLTHLSSNPIHVSFWPIGVTGDGEGGFHVQDPG